MTQNELEFLAGKKYVVCPRFIYVNNGERNYISFRQLVHCYNVDPIDCVEFQYGLSPFYPSHLKFLSVKYFGDYINADGTPNI